MSDAARFRDFLASHVTRVRPLMREVNLAWWEASTTGDTSTYERLSQVQLTLETIYTSREDFALLERLRRAEEIADPFERRQLDRLYLAYLGRQIDPALLRRTVEKSNAVERTFNGFRGTIEGRRVSDNEISEILGRSLDSRERRLAWEASKQIGQAVGPEILEVVRLRNEAARALGFRDFFQLSLALNEQDERDLFVLFDRLDALTRGPFLLAKSRLEARLASRFGTGTDSLMPWHYEDPFFQMAPDVTGLDLDALYAKQDLPGLMRDFYAGIGLDCSDIIARSDLYEKQGKSQHAFALDVDREGDIRTLMNIRPDARWADTSLHEMAHGVYDKFLDPDLPWILREANHTFTTEGIAMMFGRLSMNASWMVAMGVLPAGQEARHAPVLREKVALQELIFSRWTQVMLRFEKELYADPEQDLGAVWWGLAREYQGLTVPAGRPALDWAAKVHLTTNPVYYHNYMLGNLFASQVHGAIARELFGGRDVHEVAYVGEPRVGRFLRERVFGPGASEAWPGFVAKATGGPLGPEAFARQFVDSAR